ncbi:MAG: helix-turn-helix domain-containing protein [Nodosilinea sp. LVE1205-7]|jgi:AraC-like DNA-binding protein
MNDGNAQLVNLDRADSLLEVNPHPPTVTHWPENDRSIVMMHYDRLPAGAVPEYRPQGHHVLTLFNLSGAGLETPIDRQDWLDGQPVSLPLQVPGVGFLCPNGVAHAACWRQPLEATSFCLTRRFLDQVSQLIVGGKAPDFIPRFGLYDANLYHLAMVLKEALSSPQPGPLGQLYLEQTMMAMAVYVLRTYGVRPQPPGPAHPLDNSRLRRLFEYVEAHLATEIALPSLAIALDLGEFQLCQAFLNRMGLSLYDFIQRQRQRRAQLLLQVSAQSQEEIARLCGYGDRSTMIHHLGRSGAA